MFKEADVSPAVRLLAAMMGAHMMGSDKGHLEQMVEEAEAMNAVSRELEARKMNQTIDALRVRKMASAEHAALFSVKVAAAVSAADGDMDKLAELLEQQGIDKEAFMPLIGAAMRGVGKAVSGVGRAVGGLRMPSTATGRLLQASGEAKPALSAAGRFSQAAGAEGIAIPGAAQRAGGWLRGQGAAMQRQGGSMVRGAKPAPAGMRPPGAHPWQLPAGQPAARAAAPTAQAAVAAPAAQAAPAAAQGASKPLIGGMTKAKLMGGAAIAGAGYLGYKGMQGARDYMMAPSTAHSYGTPVANNVGPYGHPQY